MQEKWIFTLIFFLGLAFRFLSHLQPYHINDEACVILEGWNILKGEIPLFYYGQTFQGTLEGYFAALLFFIGFSPAHVFMILPFFSSALFLALFYVLSRECFGKEVALLALLFAALGPPRLVQWGHDARLHYSLVLVFQMALFWFAIKLASACLSGSALQKRISFFMGLVAGLAWWTNYLNIHSLIVSFVFIIGYLPFLRKNLFPGFLGFFLGSFPCTWFYFTHPHLFLANSALVGWMPFFSHLLDFFRGGFALMMGFYTAFSLPSFYQGVLWFIHIVFYLALLAFLFFPRRVLSKGLFLGTMASVVLITAASPFAKGILEGADYLLPLFPTFLILLAVFVNQVRVFSSILSFS